VIEALTPDLTEAFGHIEADLSVYRTNQSW